MLGQGRTRQDKTWQSKTGQDKTIQDRTGKYGNIQDRARQNKTEQDRTRHDRTRQDKIGLDRTRQDYTGQDRTGLDKTGQDTTGQDTTRHDETGKDMTRQDITGQDRTIVRLRCPACHSLWSIVCVQDWSPQKETQWRSANIDKTKQSKYGQALLLIMRPSFVSLHSRFWWLISSVGRNRYSTNRSCTGSAAISHRSINSLSWRGPTDSTATTAVNIAEKNV